MSAEFDSGLFVQKAAWHGEGFVSLEKVTNMAEALKLAGMTWRVEKRVMTYNHNGVDIETETFAIVRADNGAMLGSVGKLYEPFQNETIMGTMQVMIDAGLVDLYSLVSLRGGAKIAASAAIRGASAEVVPGDVIHGAVTVLGGHDGLTGTRIGQSATAVVCMNTYAMASREMNDIKRIVHRKTQSDRLAAARDAVAARLAGFHNSVETWRAMSKIKVTDESMRKFLAIAFPGKKEDGTEAKPNDDFMALMTRNANMSGKTLGDNGIGTKETLTRIQTEVMNIFEGSVNGANLAGRRGTAWGALSAATDYLTHHKGRTDEARAEGALFTQRDFVAVQDAAESVFLGN